jgi:hypothetical protein
MTNHTVILTPATRGKANMHLNGVYIGASRKPLFDAARYMLREGLAQPSDQLYIKWDDADHWSMKSRVDLAATKDVAENSTKGPHIIKYVDIDYSALVYSDALVDEHI